MFCDVDWPLTASRGLSVSSELLVKFSFSPFVAVPTALPLSAHFALRFPQFILFICFVYIIVIAIVIIIIIIISSSSSSKGAYTWYSAAYNPEQRHFTTTEVAADWQWLQYTAAHTVAAQSPR